MTHLLARLRIPILGLVARLVPAPMPFMLTGRGSSVEQARLLADCGARSVPVVTDGALQELRVGGGSPIDTAQAMIACHSSGRRPEDLDGYFKVRAPVVRRAAGARPEKEEV